MGLWLKKSDGTVVEINSEGIAEAPEDGKQYARKDAAWAEVAATDIDDAPEDGKQYARQDAAWSEIEAAEVLRGDPNNPPADWATDQLLYDGIEDDGSTGGGGDGKGWTGGSYDPATGTVTFTSDDGLEFTTGDLRGADGIDGLDGNVWHVGSGDPDPTLGEVNDYYLDGDAGWVWIKRSSGWTNLGVNLTGPPGDGGGGGDYLPLSGGTVTGDLQVNGNTQSWSIKNGNGNLSAPSYSFYNDPTTGLFRQDEGVLGVAGDLRAFGDLQVDGSATVGGKAVSVSDHTHDKVGGLGLAGEGVPPSGAQIVRSGTNGYTYLGWLNTTSGENTNEPTRIYTNNGGTDSFVRYMTPANFRAKVIDGNYIAAHNGAQASPGFRFNSSTSSGMYYNSNYLGLTFQGAWKLLCYSGYVRTSVPINVTDGTAAKPTFTFQSDTDTGMYRKAANKLGFSAGGNEIAYVATDGIHLTGSTTNGHWYRIDGSKGGWYCAGASTGMWVGGNGSWVTNYGSNAGIGSSTGMYGGLQATTGTSGFQYIMRSTSLSSFSYYTSSAIYKDRITTQSVSSDFDKLRPVTFIEAAPKGRSEPEEARAWRLKAKEFGFIAEEIAELYDGHLGQYEAVDGKLKPVGFSWPGLISVTVKEVQDLRKRVAANEATIASLVERIEELEGN